MRSLTRNPEPRTSLPRKALVAFLTLASLTQVGAAQSDVLAPGFAQAHTRPLPFADDPCGFAGSSTLAIEATLGDGRIVQFTGQEFLLLASDGAPLANLGSLPAAVFPSFVVVDPTETFAIVGESCNGDLFRVELSGGFTPLTNLFFNYDAVFGPDPAFVFVSASATGVFGRNQIWRVNVQDGSTTLRGRLAGYSGPLALDGDGTLYYATQPTAGTVEILTWSAAFLGGGALLNEANATTFADGLASASGLTTDPVTGHLVVTAFDAIRLLGTGGDDLGTIASAGPGTFFGSVEVHGDGGTGSLQAFQPANSRLRYTATDFFSFGQRRSAEPARPLATLTGATSGPATKTLTITGAHPNATVLIYFNDRSFWNPAEYVFGAGSFPFHTSLPVNRSRRLNPPRATDANGTATFTYDDPGSMHGTLVFQAVIFDDSGVAVGTSTYALN